MKKTKVIHHRNLAFGLPINFTLIMYLILDRFNAPGYAWGIAGTLIFVFWVVAVFDIFSSVHVDIFNKD